MPYKTKHSVLGVLVDSLDYASATNRIIQAAVRHESLSVSALAVHGVMCGVLDPELKFRLNHLDIIVPDGQPVRWALNMLYKSCLSDRVYGPNLMLKVCEEAAVRGLPIYLFGSKSSVLQRLKKNLLARFPDLRIAGMQPSQFRRLTLEEKNAVAAEIRDSGARLVFVGIGCPRQEVWAYEFRNALEMPLIAVGAAFAFHAGEVLQAPRWMQNAGLEWLFRLSVEPRRLWRRYVLLNPLYLFLLTLQFSKLTRFKVEGRKPSTELLYG
jgi:N-acetylglucosaminyldiphosphoundecaprenol N-acetyl-beta-D-mannosaminyltransferase